MADLPTEVARINALTTNARTTWFALLGVLVFVGITLMGVEHIDFYGVNRATKLPLVDVEVPTRLFFIAAPILTFAIYGYFHLYLIRLWDALGAADAFVKRTPLGDVITPWLVSDAALHLRNKKREDRCTTPRSLEGAAMVLNVALAWGFGLMILFALWMTSMAARSPDMSLVAGLMLIAAGWIGLASWLVMRRRMRGLSVTDKRPLWAWAALGLGGAAAIVFVGAVSIERTSGMLGFYPRAAAAEAAIGTWLARNDPPEADDAFDFPENFWSLGLLTLGPVNLVGEALVEKPDNWLPHDIARSEFRPKWCEREAVDCQNMSAQQADAFQAEWVTRRSAQIDALGKPEVNHVNPTQYREMNADLRAFVRANGLDLRKLDMRGAFLPGMNLVAADLNGAKLDGAVLEGADLFEAQMQQANLSAAQMERANLNSAQMDGAILNAAQMDGADLRFAHVKGANLVDSHLTRSDLRGTHMQGADLSFASLVAADLRSAQMEGQTSALRLWTERTSAVRKCKMWT
ncbi:pentapeptide repeat-containing protein [Tateyamaria pelophila]|uniref:pentapeptide repeat-containing protein n=1 Tax=Tateyamaria pelophila TaxID=328415 RepID=UPI001CBDA978|nr:pentapeptide repeat-containing protein [Tateyamaria pelophila]